MRFQASRVAFCPQLVQVVPQTQEVKFGGNVCPAPGEEAFEFAVAFQYPKSAFHLNGAVDPEHNSSFTCNILP